MAARKASLQLRLLRRKCCLRTLGMLALYTVVFVLAAVAFELVLKAPLAEWVAEATSYWIIVDPDSLSDFVEQHDGGYEWQIIMGGDGMFHARDLHFYNIVRAAKIPLAVALFAAGAIAIAIAGLMRPLRYFDELAHAVTALVEDRTRPVELSSDLAITQNELNAVRAASLANESAAVAAERRKNELVAYLAHDIKTPLTSVIGYLALLDEAPDLPEDARRRYIATASEKAVRLEGLIDEFFEITRYNLQSIPIERTWVGVRLFCEQVAESFYPDAQARGLSLVVRAPDDARFFVDADKLARALGNVVRNAVAYADDGTEIVIAASFAVSAENATAGASAAAGASAVAATTSDAESDASAGANANANVNATPSSNVTDVSSSPTSSAQAVPTFARPSAYDVAYGYAPAVSGAAGGATLQGGGASPASSAASAFVSAPGAGSWVLSVTNQGREISPAHLQSIFDKFYREDGARGTGSGGAGLGLAIAKEIIAAHGGTIGAMSERGVTTFAITLPA